MRRRQSNLKQLSQPQLSQPNRLHQQSAYYQPKSTLSHRRFGAVASAFVETWAHHRVLLLRQLLLAIVMLIAMFGLSVLQASEPATDKAPAVSLPDQVVQIDAMIKEVWDAYELTPSRNASDSELSLIHI